LPTHIVINIVAVSEMEHKNFGCTMSDLDRFAKLFHCFRENLAINCNSPFCWIITFFSLPCFQPFYTFYTAWSDEVLHFTR